ncbi:MAG: 2-amino-4-hydroxy-6-hydroxymethyldihydropteridine diphosphokinase [Betaproteobacteria bacterium]|nr:2-amino-4-hydroxy-6-hydroxymethyldihydropteridine diphosphokinase [Betaproteobacteria bacterium]
MTLPTRDPVDAFVAVGANLGDAAAAVRQALQGLALLPRTQLTGTSSLYRSEPWQAQGPVFVNAVAKIRTELTAPDLLIELQAAELAAGRVRSHPNAPRTLDLDLLFYGDAKVVSPQLILPHPRWMERAFVLLPLQELAPHKVIPVMLHAVADQVIEKMA